MTVKQVSHAFVYHMSLSLHVCECFVLCFFLCEQIEALLLSTSGQLFQILKF
jgi:hypothetical protein